MSEVQNKSVITLDGPVVAWAGSIFCGATLLFWGWVAVTLIEVRAEVALLHDQREQSLSIVTERLTMLGGRVGRLEEQVERLRYGPGQQGSEQKRQ